MKDTVSGVLAGVLPKAAAPGSCAALTPIGTFSGVSGAGVPGAGVPGAGFADGLAAGLAAVAGLAAAAAMAASRAMIATPASGFLRTRMRLIPVVPHCSRSVHNE